MRPIVICGKMCSGKTTIANYLVKKHNYIRKYSFADWMRRTLRDHYNCSIVKGEKVNGEDVRDLLCRFGNMMREFDKDWHVDELSNKIIDDLNSDNFIVDDCRFPNEAEVFADRFKAVIIQVISPESVRISRGRQRDGVAPTKESLASDSEKSVDNIVFKYGVYNNGDIYSLYRVIDMLMREING